MKGGFYDMFLSNQGLTTEQEWREGRRGEKYITMALISEKDHVSLLI